MTNAPATYFTDNHAVSMTMRDYFAAKAMQSLIAVYNDDKTIVKEYAQRAFEIADAMMEAREK